MLVAQGGMDGGSSPNSPLTLQGRIFIDRIGTLFDEVLSLLRAGPEWRPPEDRCVLRPAAGISKEGQGGGVHSLVQVLL